MAQSSCPTRRSRSVSPPLLSSSKQEVSSSDNTEHRSDQTSGSHVVPMQSRCMRAEGTLNRAGQLVDATHNHQHAPTLLSNSHIMYGFLRESTLGNVAALTGSFACASCLQQGAIVHIVFGFSSFYSNGPHLCTSYSTETRT
jgi:hypothetical protein